MITGLIEGHHGHHPGYGQQATSPFGGGAGGAGGHPQHPSMAGQLSQQAQQQQQSPYNPATVAAAAAAAAAAGYPMQSMDTRSAVVQVSNFPDQVRSLSFSHSLFFPSIYSFLLCIYRIFCFLYITLFY